MTMSIAVVFYSAEGNAALAAKALAEKLGAKRVELKEFKPRNLSKVGFAFMVAGFQAAVKSRSKLVGQPWQDVSGCDELHVITPIWAAKPVPAINTFIANCDFSGKKVSVYTVQADPSDSAKPAREAMAETIRKKGGVIAGSYGLVGGGPGKPANDDLAQKINNL
jgi:flavodoxin